MDVNITARPAAVAAAMERAGECYTGDERRVTERRAVPPAAPDEDLLEVARTICAIAERMSTMTAQQLQLYPSPTCEGSPVLLAARAAIVKRGYNPDGTSVPGRSYPTSTAAQQLPVGWVALSIVYNGEMEHPEEVAYGPPKLMDRLGKWLDKFMAREIADKAAG